MGIRRAMMLLAAAVLLAAPPSAHARMDTELRYRFAQAWGAAVRLVRVDYGFPIRDRDEEVGYLLFDYRDGDRSYPASFELVKVRAHGEERVKVALTIPDMPSYIERMILDKLERKLEKDYGEPPPPRPAPDRRKKKGEGDEEEDGASEGSDGKDEGGKD
ncbi:MAG: hypothetical protein ACOC97_00320 [Myxococcota bacterium]